MPNINAYNPTYVTVLSAGTKSYHCYYLLVNGNMHLHMTFSIQHDMLLSWHCSLSVGLSVCLSITTEYHADKLLLLIGTSCKIWLHCCFPGSFFMDDNDVHWCCFRIYRSTGLWMQLNGVRKSMKWLIS